jgi:hypothetical protein
MESLLDLMVRSCLGRRFVASRMRYQYHVQERAKETAHESKSLS